MEPDRYFVRVIKREKLACRRCPEGGVVTAAAGGPPLLANQQRHALSPLNWKSSG
jgi:hypothetical protein